MPRTIIVPPGTKVFRGGRFVGTVPGPVEESAKPAVPEDEDPAGIKGVVSKLIAKRQTPPAQASPAETPEERYARATGREGIRPQPEPAEEPAVKPAQTRETKPAGAKPAAEKQEEPEGETPSTPQSKTGQRRMPNVFS